MTALDGAAVAGGAVVANEFAAIQVSVDYNGGSPRLLLEDLTTGKSIYLDPLEMASLCEASDDDRQRWLLVGAYRPAP